MQVNKHNEIRGKMNYTNRYLEVVNEMYDQIVREESENIKRIAEMLSKSIVEGHIAHIFGTGHSEMVCKEVFTRAGNLSCFRIIGMNFKLEKFERLDGMAKIILDNYLIETGELVFVISSSGINSLPIEVAMHSKEKGANVIAFTSLSHSKSVKSRHKSGKKLYELADIVVDTHVPAGDAAVELEGLTIKVAPVSSLANIFLINSIVVETTALILQQGKTPPIRLSRNLPGGDEHNKRFIEKYYQRIPEIIL